MNTEKNHFLKSLIFPLFMLILMWGVKLLEYYGKQDFSHLGILPLKAEGLLGILTGPFIHENFDHLISNSVPLFLLTLSLFYFYRGIAAKVFFLVYFMSGILVWLSGRDAYHIGASSLIYGFAGFLFFSGILRRDSRLAALTLLIAFLYGGLVWGIFPDFFPGMNISYEGHFWGLTTGVVFAVYYRKSGPQRVKYSWELEEKLSLEDEAKGTPTDSFWRAPRNFDDFMFKL